MKNHKIYTKIIIAAALIGLAVAWRLLNNNYRIAPNLELVTTVSILAAIILGMRFGVIVPIVTMIISDLVIGNTSIFMYTWSSFAVIGLSAVALRRYNNRPTKQIAYSIGFAVVSSFLFFAITNFGVWAQGWYPATWAGLGECFVMAIPFYRTMLIGNMILVPTAVSVWQAVRIHSLAKNSVVDSLVR